MKVNVHMHQEKWETYWVAIDAIESIGPFGDLNMKQSDGQTITIQAYPVTLKHIGGTHRTLAIDKESGDALLTVLQEMEGKLYG